MIGRHPVACLETEDFFFGPNGVTRHWLKTGIAGYRTDVTPWITETMWRRFFKAMRAAKPDVYLIAEDWGDNTPRFTGDQFDAAMNYRFAYTVIRGYLPSDRPPENPFLLI